MDAMEIRRNAIVELVNKYGTVSFSQIKEQFSNVSEMTLRTDLKALDEAKEIVRIHGDGVPVFGKMIQENLKVPYSFAPAHVNKQRAAAVAALGGIYVKEGKVVTAMEHVPEYLRVSQAERERAQKLQEEKASEKNS